MHVPVRNQPLFQKIVANETQETNMGDRDVDTGVLDILPSILETESQIHKMNHDVTPENNFILDDDHVHEDGVVDTIVDHVGVINKNNEKIKFA